MGDMNHNLLCDIHVIHTHFYDFFFRISFSENQSQHGPAATRGVSSSIKIFEGLVGETRLKINATKNDTKHPDGVLRARGYALKGTIGAKTSLCRIQIHWGLLCSPAWRTSLRTM
jgi:hypothetical protein